MRGPITEFNVEEFIRDQDIRKLPLVLRQFIKCRVFVLHKLKFRAKLIALALGIKVKAVTSTIYKSSHFDRQLEDFRANNGRSSKHTYLDLARMLNQ